MGLDTSEVLLDNARTDMNVQDPERSSPGIHELMRFTGLDDHDVSTADVSSDSIYRPPPVAFLYESNRVVRMGVEHRTATGRCIDEIRGYGYLTLLCSFEPVRYTAERQIILMYVMHRTHLRFESTPSAAAQAPVPSFRSAILPSAISNCSCALVR